MDNLFPDSEITMESPRLKWLKKHNLAIGELPDGTRFCVGLFNTGYGSTHRDAELECAAAAEIEHYSITEFVKTGAVIAKDAQEEVC